MPQPELSFEDVPASLSAAVDVSDDEDQAPKQRPDEIPESLKPLLAADPVLAKEYRDVSKKLGLDPFKDMVAQQTTQPPPPPQAGPMPGYGMPMMPMPMPMQVPG